MEMGDKIPIKKINITRLAGVCGILIPVVIFLCISLAMTDAPWFEWTQHALSDLGIGGISAFFFNNGLIIGGILVLIFSIGLAKSFTKKTGAYILAISAIGLIGAGLFPKTIFELHFISSATFFVFLTLALFVIGLTLINDKLDHKMAIIAIVFAMFACTSPVLLGFLRGVAIPEAIVAFPAFIWCMIYGYKMMNFKQPRNLL